MNTPLSFIFYFVSVFFFINVIIANTPINSKPKIATNMLCNMDKKPINMEPNSGRVQVISTPLR
ncbi:MAG: hypothetical protein C4545_07870 [Anaerolineaceae bacterium]|nr:MAG: hypothetical protein C4545_07870 [Anaerolineaceae bacterium]